MLKEVLNRLGFSWSAPSPPGFNVNMAGAPDSVGQADVTFTPRAREAFTPHDMRRAVEERGERSAGNELVWPGIHTTVLWRNETPVEFRYEFSVTDLPTSFYSCQPAQGGMWRQEGGVVLQPGEDVIFPIQFLPPHQNGRNS